MKADFLLLAVLLGGCGDPFVESEPDATVFTLDAALLSPDAFFPADAAPTPDAEHCGELGELCCLAERSCNNDAHMDFYCARDDACAGAPVYRCLPAVSDCGIENGPCCRPYCNPITGFCPAPPCHDGLQCQADVCVLEGT